MKVSYPGNNVRKGQEANPRKGDAVRYFGKNSKEGGSRNAKVGTERLSIPTPSGK